MNNKIVYKLPERKAVQVDQNRLLYTFHSDLFSLNIDYPLETTPPVRECAVSTEAFYAFQEELINQHKENRLRHGEENDLPELPDDFLHLTTYNAAQHSVTFILDTSLDTTTDLEIVEYAV